MLTYITNECMPLEKMLARVQKQHPGDSYLLVEKAYKFAEQAHAGQVRKSGEPYFIHPVSVASILTDLMIDAPTIAAGFLHDTVPGSVFGKAGQGHFRIACTVSDEKLQEAMERLKDLSACF